MNTFFSLLKNSFRFCMIAKVPFLIGTIVFGLAIPLSVTYLAPSIALDGRMDLELKEQMNNLAKSIEVGDEDEISRLMEELEMIPKDELEQADESLSASFFTPELMGGLALLAFVLILIFLLGQAYFLVLAVDQELSIGALINKAIRVFVPLIGVSIWATIRSFAWIPILGIFTGIYYFPRFAFAGVILVGEKKGVIESVNESLSRTKGSWFRIVGNYIGLIVILIIVHILIKNIFDFDGRAVSMVVQVINCSLTAFSIVFTVYLAKSVMSQSATAPVQQAQA
ncbi:hypothetical protein KKF03_04860, partial [Patescibacteria group bacterium]|nr:hypothetical protein [Patescibacteria group bacterium]